MGFLGWASHEIVDVVSSTCRCVPFCPHLCVWLGHLLGGQGTPLFWNRGPPFSKHGLCLGVPIDHLLQNILYFYVGIVCS